jgi:hypothetical protein
MRVLPWGSCVLPKRAAADTAPDPHSWLLAGKHRDRLPLSLTVEAVEKVPEQIPGGNSEKSDLIECATINDLMLGRGQETPENHPLIVIFDFFYRLVSHSFNRKSTPFGLD